MGVHSGSRRAADPRYAAPMRRPWFIVAAVAALSASAAAGATTQAMVADQSAPDDGAATIQQIADLANGYLSTTSTSTTEVPPSSTSTTADAPTASTSTNPTTAPTTSTTDVPTAPTTSSTSTTAPSTTQPSPTSTGCSLAAAAFCETFDRADGDPATRSGDLNAVIWGVSRTSTFVNLGQQLYNQWPQATLTGCGAPTNVSPPNDVRVCNGRVILPVADHEAQPILAIYPKQPFDIAGRTGTVVFDVSADSEGPHAAWPEFWWTDQPVPAPHAGELPAQGSYPRNSFGFVIASQCGVNHGALIGIDQMTVTRNNVAAALPFNGGACVTKGSATGTLNHFEIRISQDRVEVWGTDAGSSSLKLMATATNANLTMTRGLIWVENVHYNAGKFDNQEDHEFAFDNIGFDGPRPYRDLSFDVPDNHGSNLGWRVGASPVVLETVPVFTLQPPTSALVTFNYWAQGGDQTVPQTRLNGGPWHVTPKPGGTTDGWSTIAVPVPVSEVVDGPNFVEMRTDGTQQVVSNINVILGAGAPVP